MKHEDLNGKILASWCWRRVNYEIEYYIVDTDGKCWISHDMGENYILIGDYIAGTLGLGRGERMEKDEKIEDWKLEIIKGNNGYVLTSSPEHLIMVIEDDEEDELQSHEDLLWEIMNYFNFGGSKHDPERISITRIKKEVK